jgi:carbon monoxide dehydrogenase subunit G
MASIRKEILIEASTEHVWAAVRDVGALHQRLVPGFVVDTRLEADARIVTFGNGMVVRELIVDLDEQARRLAWSARGGRLTHHNASVQVFADGEGCSRLVWIADLLPNELAADIRAMIEQAAAVMKPTLEGRATGAEACRIRS